MVSVTREAMRLHCVCLDISCTSCSLKSVFLMLVSWCMSKGMGEKRQTNKLNPNMHKSQGLINFWWKKTVTGTDIYPMKEIFECYCVRQDAMTKKKVLWSRILGGNVTVPWQESQVAKVTDSSWTGLPMPCSGGWGGNWQSKEVVAGTWHGGEGKEKGQ